MRCWITLALAVRLGFAGAAFGEPNPPAPANLVVNGGFEQEGAGWRYVNTGVIAAGKVDGAEAHEGKYSYKLTNKSAQAPTYW